MQSNQTIASDTNVCMFGVFKPDVRTFRVLLLLVMFISVVVVVSARADEAPKIVSVKMIWDHAKHHCATDLIRFQDRWWCTFREAEAHGGGEGKIRVIVSDDGNAWEAAALMSEAGRDLRDPHLSIMADGRLMCVFAGSIWSFDGKNSWDGRSQALTRSPRVAFSDDGHKWTPPKKVLAEDHWLWRVTWHKGRAYSMSKLGEGRDPRRLMLYTSTDGLDWQWVTEPRLPDNARNGSETTLRFLPDDTMVALTRPHWIGTAQPPYRKWNWARIVPEDRPANSRVGDLGGPNFIRLPDGSLWASARLYGPRKRTVLAQMTPTSFKPVLVLPSGGDNSYPGMVWHEGMLWMSYYSGHEGKARIYLARVKVN